MSTLTLHLGHSCTPIKWRDSRVQVETLSLIPPNHHNIFYSSIHKLIFMIINELHYVKHICFPLHDFNIDKINHQIKIFLNVLLQREEIPYYIYISVCKQDAKNNIPTVPCSTRFLHSKRGNKAGLLTHSHGSFPGTFRSETRQCKQIVCRDAS